MNILLLSAYDAVSHQYWRKGLVENFAEYNWTVLTLPARFFAWRVRGNSLSWAFNAKPQLQQNYDLIICTSMTDLSALLGLAPGLAGTPSLIYFHENQFEYPSSGNEFNKVEPQILSIYSALAATKVVFNSDFNRRTFLEGARNLLKKMPDHVPDNLVEHIAAKSYVLAVPLCEASQFSLKNQQPYQHSKLKSNDKPLQVIWNHRWEFDKGPELLLFIVEKLIENKCQ